jgi:hypothetical protein
MGGAVWLERCGWNRTSAEGPMMAWTSLQWQRHNDVVILSATVSLVHCSVCIWNPAHTKEIVRQIGQLICLHGFTTNPEKPGVECLVVTRPRPEIGMASDFQFHPRDIADEDGRDHMLEPHGVVFCKGWTRAFIFITVMRLCYDHPNLKEARPSV